MSATGVPIGIDLGTTHACVAASRKEGVEVIANDQGFRSTSCMVGFTKVEKLFGIAAANQVAVNATNTVYDLKALLVRSLSTEAGPLPDYPFKVTGEGADLAVEVTFEENTVSYTPKELCAMMLENMRNTAETYLGAPVSGAVLTVPTSFTEAQRTALEEAAEAAGLPLLGLINEPTAAAMAYDLDICTDGKEHSTVVTVDLGGARLDYNVISVDKGMMRLVASTSNASVGGRDFSARLVKFFAKQFARKQKVDIKDDIKSMLKLERACEKAKKVLSQIGQASLDVDSLHEGVDFFSNITRTRFEALCSDLFSSVVDGLPALLQQAGVDKSQVDTILLLGGASHMPRLKTLVAEYFNVSEDEVRMTVLPDEAGAIGAAIQASLLVSNPVPDDAKPPTSLVTTVSVGVEGAGGVFVPLVPRNTSLPVSGTCTLATILEQQKAVGIKVLQGERGAASANKLIGTMCIGDLAKSKVKLHYSMDVTGTLVLTANDITLELPCAECPTVHMVDEMIADAHKHQAADDALKARATALGDLQSVLSLSRVLVSNLPFEQSHETLAACDDASVWLAQCVAKSAPEKPERDATLAGSRARKLKALCNTSLTGTKSKDAESADDEGDEGESESEEESEAELSDAGLD